MGCISDCADFFTELKEDLLNVNRHSSRLDRQMEELKLESVILRTAGVAGAIFASFLGFFALTLLPFSSLGAVIVLSLAALVGVGAHDAIQVGANEKRLIKALGSIQEKDNWFSQLSELASRTQFLRKAGMSEINGISWKLQGTWLIKEIVHLF